MHKNNETRLYIIYMYKQDLALDNLKWLICYKINETVIYKINV